MDLKSFMMGVSSTSLGKIGITQVLKTGIGAEVVSVDFDENYCGKITYSDGTQTSVTGVEFDGDKIKTLYVTDSEGVPRVIDCTYETSEETEDSYLRAVGEIPILDIESLGITTSGGSGGGTEMMEQTVLYSDYHDNEKGDILTLSDTINNYDALAVSMYIGSLPNTPERISECIIIPDGSVRQLQLLQNGSYYASFNVQISNTSLEIKAKHLSGWQYSGIYKVIGLKFVSRINYSTEEQCIGTWIDGKPLYQKTFTGQVTSNYAADSGVAKLPDGAEGVYVEGYMLYGSNAWSNPGRMPINCRYKGDNFQFYGTVTGSCGWNFTGSGIWGHKDAGKYVLTYRYTKTTD